MADTNLFVAVVRATRDPEVKTFNGGGKVAQLGLALNDRKKNKQTGAWEDVPIWIDAEAWNRGESGKLADIIEKYVKKGSRIAIQGKLAMDEWQDKSSGQKRTKLKVVINEVQLLDSKQDGQGGNGGGGYSRQQAQPQRQAASASNDNYDGPPDQEVPF